MNDGQRPRIGGRELSVADVNVQNVSQGLSAALYSSGGPNPQGGSDSGMQGDDMQGQNPGNQGNQGNQGHGGQQGQGGQPGPGPRPAGWPAAGKAAISKAASSTAISSNRRARPGPAPASRCSGNVAQANGHDGNNYGNYADATSASPTYAPPTEPARAAAPVPAEDQPDYPEELLPVAAPAARRGAARPRTKPEDGVQRTLRAPRPRLRGPRRGPRQGGAPGRRPSRANSELDRRR